MSERDALALDPGEQVIWRGRPDPLGYAWYKGKKRLVSGAIQLVLCIYIAIRIHGMWRAPSGGRMDEVLWSISLMTVLATLFMLVVAVASLLDPLWRFLEARRARYALTNRRAIVSVAAPFSRLQSFPLAALPFLAVQPTGAGRGHVLFASAGSGHWSPGPVQDGFVAVSEPAAVERLLGDLSSPGGAGE